MGKAPAVVQLERINWDVECRIDLMTKKGFVVRDFAFVGDREKTKYGIHSPLFGSDWEDEDAFSDRYSCRCKETIGMVFEGEVCPKCETVVEYRDVDLEMTGWIILNNSRIIQPEYYRILSFIINDKSQHNIESIITPNFEVDENGKIVDEIENEKNMPFFGIGIDGLYENYDEVLDYFWKKKKTKRGLIDEIRGDREACFTSCIPVYSSVLRPISFGTESYFFTKVDKHYNAIRSKVVLVNKIQVDEDEETVNDFVYRQLVLSTLQKKLMELWDVTFTQVESKHGHIREEILGGRINYSARNVIIPDSTLRADEVVLGYVTFLELYRYEIIGYLVKTTDCTYEEAGDEWSHSIRNFNPRVYEIINHIIAKHKPIIVINRNPTINYGSLMSMKVKKVRPILDDNYTMSLPIAILAALNADFDGDILNIISLKFVKLSKEFDENYNPRKNMFISRNDGLFDKNYGLPKDQMIGLFKFNNSK